MPDLLTPKAPAPPPPANPTVPALSVSPSSRGDATFDLIINYAGFATIETAQAHGREILKKLGAR